MNCLLKSAHEMVKDARIIATPIKMIDALSTLGDTETLFVDVRHASERRLTGYIPGSLNVPRDIIEFAVDPETPFYQEDLGYDMRYVFYSFRDDRSALAVATLQAMGFAAEYLQDGFAEWEACGGPIERVRGG